MNLAKALNAATATELMAALNFELPQVTEGAPEWIQLLPPCGCISGRDGRSWHHDNPGAIVAQFESDGKYMPLDWEHSTELKAPKGEEAPAAGWFTILEAREGGTIWGRVEWTDKGREAVASKSYRYISPVFLFERETGRIIALTSVGLTNRPNLHLPALNREQQQQQSQKGTPMELEQLLAALGLPAGTSFAAALNHISQMKTSLATALNAAQSPSLDKFVPKADYDLALNRATTAEGKLEAQAKETLETAINTEIDAALKAGKITPATRDYHVAQCRQEGGLDRFKTFCQAAPTVAGDSALDGKKPGDTDTALNAEEVKVAAMFGNTAEDIKKYGKGE